MLRSGLEKPEIEPEEELLLYEHENQILIEYTSLLYASTRVTFHLILRPSRHASVLPVTSPSPSSLCFTYRSLSSFIVSPSFVFRLFLRYGSIPPLFMFRASFLGFVATLSYFNIFTFLWLDNKFIVFVIL